MGIRKRNLHRRRSGVGEGEAKGKSAAKALRLPLQNGSLAPAASTAFFTLPGSGISFESNTSRCTVVAFLWSACAGLVLSLVCFDLLAVFFAQQC